MLYSLSVVVGGRLEQKLALLSGASGAVVGQAEMLLGAVLVSPQGLPVQGAQHLATRPVSFDNTRAPQHTQMPGNKRLAESKLSAELGHRDPLVLREVVQDRQPLPVAQGTEIEGELLHHHSIHINET